MSNKGTRKDTYSLSLTIEGRDCGIWDKMTGGGVDSEETKYRPGALADEISLGGQQTFENVTVSRLYDLDRDHGDLVKFLMNRAGRGEGVLVKQPLDRDKVPYGDPLVYTITLKSCKPPEVDSESSDAGLLEIEGTVTGPIA